MASYRWLHLLLITGLGIIWIILLSHTTNAQPNVYINEVMYHPAENEHYHEWIELYNPTEETINLAGWTLWDGQEEDTLMADTDHGNGTTFLSPHSYALITDKGTKVYDHYTILNTTTKLYVDDATLCGYGLKNDGEYLYLNNTNAITIDTLEWGQDTPRIPGNPTFLTNQGESLISIYTNNPSSLLRFACSHKPTPGTTNQESFRFTIIPQYIAKPTSKKTNSIPYSFQIQLLNFPVNNTYICKAYALGNITRIWPASQTWNGTKWRYSNNYTHTFTLNKNNNNSYWFHLRLNPAYQEFKQSLRNNHICYQIIKFKNQTHTYQYIHPLSLLDLSHHTNNGTRGGYLIGQLDPSQPPINNTLLIIKNIHNQIISLSFSENNTLIEDNTPTIPGYYKIPVPEGQNYRLFILGDNNSYKKMQEKISVTFGTYTHRLSNKHHIHSTPAYKPLSIPIYLQNTGSFTDTYTLTLHTPLQNWETSLHPTNITLNPQELANIYVHITPKLSNPGPQLTTTVSATSSNDPTSIQQLSFTISLNAPDLTITNMSSRDIHNIKQTHFFQGQPIRLKAHIKNQGTTNASNVSIAFYHTKITPTHHIQTKHYPNIGKYYKYPSIEWDTTGFPPGTYQVYAVIDPKNHIKEADETNNQYSIQITLQPLDFDTNASMLKITEVYYHSHPTIHNEFIALTNAGKHPFNLSGWYITTTPSKRFLEQKKIMFPPQCIIPAQSTWYLTQNATMYQKETGTFPTFEYYENSTPFIPDLLVTQSMILSNSQGIIVLKTPDNQTIDVVQYAKPAAYTHGWHGLPIPSSGQGKILKRRWIHQFPIDTNTSQDWYQPRPYAIGQSNLTYTEINITGTVIPFVSPDCSHSTITAIIEQAQTSILLNMYEFTSPSLYSSLVAALCRNISVTIFMEGSPIGGIDPREQYILSNLAQLGANIRFIISDTSNKIHARYTFDHAKYLIIDNQSVIVESCNWVKTGVPDHPSFGNREWGIYIQNRTVADYFYSVFHHDFNPACQDSVCLSDIHFQTPTDFILNTQIYTGKYQPCFEAPSLNGSFTVIPVFSPDTSNYSICRLIESAQSCIDIQQLYIYPFWEDRNNPFITRLIEKAAEGIKIRIILNYNPLYGPTNDKINITKKILSEQGIKVKFLYTNWSIFSNMHNKGMIVDNTTVLISSINWNKNAVLNNREAGVIIKNKDVATYFLNVFNYDWQLHPEQFSEKISFSLSDFKNQIIIVLVYIFTFALIIQDWRKRQWN